MRFTVFMAALTASTSAWADMIPPPSRPEWNDPPAPLPAPLEALVVAAVMVAAIALVHRARKSRGARAT